MGIEEILVGSRVSVPNRGRGTVRWIGKLGGLESVRVGIELDNSTGTNSGDYKGNYFFKTIENKGIFIKLVQGNFEPLRTFIEALNFKYIENNNNDSSIELVGEEKANKYFSQNIWNLFEISLNELNLYKIDNYDLSKI